MTLDSQLVLDYVAPVSLPLKHRVLPLKHRVYCRVLNGVMFQKDVVAPGRMRRKIHKPRILLLDCPLEYKKGENQTNVEIEKEEDW